MKGIAFSAIGVVLACLAPMAAYGQATPTSPAAAQGDAVPYQTLTGALTRADHERYREIPFVLPEGVTRLTVRFSYGGKDQHSVIDLGLADPERFRGWSGGTRDHMTLSIEDATPGYLPGPLPGGQWRLILGAPNIREGARAPFEAKIFIERQPVVTAFSDAPINPAPGWYRGDLHMHSGNSDGKCSSQTGEKVPCPIYRTLEAAVGRGLDFIALTDHNTTSHFEALRELQGSFDKLLLIPGREVTTFYGHANIFGPTDFVNFQMTAPGYAQAAQWMDAAKREGGVVSINHPGAPSGELCMGCGWGVDDLPPGAVQAIEVVNGGMMAQTGSAEGPLQGFKLWHDMLGAGQHVTAIGGSDNHNADIPADKPAAIGTPTTVIFMQSLSVEGFLDGIRSGRVFIDVRGAKPGSLLDLSATSGKEVAEMGGTLHPRSGAAVYFKLDLKGVAGGTAHLLIDGKADGGEGRPIGSDGVIDWPAWTSDTRPHWVHAEVRDAQRQLILIGNPVYIAPRR